VCAAPHSRYTKEVSQGDKTMISVQKEPVSITAEFHGLLEPCYFCKSPTQHWHRPTNTPVCEVCAGYKDVNEIDRPLVNRHRRTTTRLVA
jgi:hypothetical protein